MDSPKIVYKYYSNPAFCGQSERGKMISPDRRMPPLGANSPRTEIHNRILRTDISDNPLRMSPATRMRDEPPELPPKPAKYRQFHRQASLVYKQTRQVRSRTRSEDLEMAQIRQKRYDRNAESDDGLEDRRNETYDERYNERRHRYEIIQDMDDLEDYSPTKKRILQANPNEIEEYNVDGPDDNELKEIPTEIIKTVNGKTMRYAIVPVEDDEPKRITFSPMMSQKNLIATQKLHELLSTPRKLKSYGSQPSVRITPNKERYGTPQKMISSTPQGVTPSKSCANLLNRSMTSPISPKAQQKLNYGLPDFERVFVTSPKESFERDTSRESRRNFGRSQRRDKTTAVIVPRIAQPPSEYSDTTYKSISIIKKGAAATLIIAALMLTLCGGLTTGLSFYMMYAMGRHYYLDFGVMAGFTCFLLGLLGLRARRQQLLPNRNYISGYIVLSSFSLLSALCTKFMFYIFFFLSFLMDSRGYILLSSFSLLSAFGLLILLTVQPKLGTPLNDITSGAVCGVSILSLCLASMGVLTSYCCARDPPDNRVGTARWY